MRCLSVLVGVTFACGPAGAADWPQWLGPTRDGASPEKVAPWKEAPKVLWRVPAGEGHSSPVVAGGKVFLHAKVKDAEAEEVVAFDAATGKEVWKKAYDRDKFSSIFGNGPRATPAVSGGRLYTLGVTGELTCWEADTGKELWQVDTQKDFAPSKLLFGVSCSPLVADKKVFVNVGGKGASVVAFGAEKGDVVWKALDDQASYSSPILVGEGKGTQLLVLTAKGLASLGPADGTLHWQFPLVDKLFESSTTPVRVGDLVLASSITYGTAALRLETKDGKPGYAEAWKEKGLTCYFSTPVAVGKDHVYVVTGSNPLTTLPNNVKADLRCVEAKSGKTLWTQPKVGKYHASLLRLGDNKLLLLEDTGNLALVEPSPEKYQELARAQVCGETWAHPALADGRLYIRDAKELICLELAK